MSDVAPETTDAVSAGDTPPIGGGARALSTPFTSGGLVEVNKKTPRWRGGISLLFTSFTSFLKGRGMHAPAPARAVVRVNLSPLRGSGKRSKQRGGTPFKSSDYPVNFPVYFGVHRTVSLTSPGEQGVAA